MEDDTIFVPIKKLSILEDGAVGKMRLEVVVDDMLFTPWEGDFVVKRSKNVMVKVHEQKSDRDGGSGIRVRIK